MTDPNFSFFAFSLSSCILLAMYCLVKSSSKSVCLYLYLGRLLLLRVVLHSFYLICFRVCFLLRVVTALSFALGPVWFSSRWGGSCRV